MDRNTVEMAMLFDFFGELLTEKQREYFDLYYNEDLSLAEIAENVGITRQGVYDIITRAENTLRDAERKTHVIERFALMQQQISSAQDIARQIADSDDIEQARSLAKALIDELENLKG